MGQRCTFQRYTRPTCRPYLLVHPNLDCLATSFALLLDMTLSRELLSAVLEKVPHHRLDGLVDVSEIKSSRGGYSEVHIGRFKPEAIASPSKVCCVCRSGSTEEHTHFESDKLRERLLAVKRMRVHVERRDHAKVRFPPYHAKPNHLSNYLNSDNTVVDRK